MNRELHLESDIQRSNKRHWVVKVIRLFGYINLFVALLILLPLSEIIIQSRYRIIGYLLAGVIAITTTIAHWAVALFLDDIHAIRIQTAYYIGHMESTEDQE